MSIVCSLSQFHEGLQGLPSGFSEIEQQGNVWCIPVVSCPSDGPCGVFY